MSEIILGTPVKDAITGFSGIAVSKLETLSGNVMISIQPRSEKNDEVKDAKLFRLTPFKKMRSLPLGSSMAGLFVLRRR